MPPASRSRTDRRACRGREPAGRIRARRRPRGREGRLVRPRAGPVPRDRRRVRLRQERHRPHARRAHRSRRSRSSADRARASHGARPAARCGPRRGAACAGSEVGFVLQDALVSLDPLRPVGDEIAEALRLHGWGDRALARRERCVELLDAVGVPEPEVRARQRPDELSGGLRQRALIASAIALDPTLVIADEPTTALDVTVQAQVLDLLERVEATRRVDHPDQPRPRRSWRGWPTRSS